MKTMNVGMLGYGFSGKFQSYGYMTLPLFYDKLPFEPRITHVCTSRKETADQAKAIIRAGTATTDFRDVTENPDVDIVHICTPNHLHKDALLSAIRHNKHIFCDKPLTATAKEAEEIREALKDYEGTAQMTFHFRFFPATIRAKQLIGEGFLGQILEFRSTFLHAGSANPDAPVKWKLSAEAGGGVIADLGSHVLDLMHFLLGEFESVNALTHIAYPERPSASDPGKRVPVDTEDLMMVLAKTKSGAAGFLEATKIATGSEDELRFEIHGNKGALRFNSMAPHYLEAFDASAPSNPVGGYQGWTRIATGQRYPEPAAAFPSPKCSMGWLRSQAACLANFLFAVADNQPGDPGLIDGIYVQQLMDFIRKSAQDRQWVECTKSIASTS